MGRDNDVIRMSDGRRIIGTDEVFSGADHVVEGQVVQEERERFMLKVVPACGFGEKDRAALIERLRQRVGDVRISVELVDSIERTAAGKFRPVVSKVSTEVGQDEER